MIVWVVLKFIRGLHDLKIIGIDANFTTRMLAEELNE